MSQRKTLEKVLNLLVNEEHEKAAELLHQVIVEKARSIYESMIDEEDDEVGGSADEDFTDEISVDKEEIDADELYDGEVEDELEADDDEPATVGDLEELEDKLEELRAEFDALYSEEIEEPEHEDLPAEMDSIEDEYDFDSEEDEEPAMFEAKTQTKRVDQEKRAANTKQRREETGKPKHRKEQVDEETQFLTKVAPVEKGEGKYVGTGKGMPTGETNTKSTFSNAPAKPNYGGKPVEMGKGTSLKPGQSTAKKPEKLTDEDNIDVVGKKVASPSGKEGKYVGTGKDTPTGSVETKGPLSKAPKKSV
jgi:hypothetical protein